MRNDKENIVIFSSGESERNGTLDKLKNCLSEVVNATSWRELFADAKHADMIALLPMLIKKIPTFDFAVIICEGHDVTKMVRGELSETVKTMRDNVLFEIGLTVMALGLAHVIIVKDDEVRLPDDLIGERGEISIFSISLNEKMEDIAKKILQYVEIHKDDYSPVVVGAAASTAIGYLQNFILRTFEEWSGQVLVGASQPLNISRDNVRFEIYVPDIHDESGANSNLDFATLQKGYIPKEGTRGIVFRFYMKGDKMIIVDVPTTMKTSYSTADIILHLEADDEFDTFAENRFILKELKLFYRTLKTLLKPDKLLKLCNNRLDEETIKQCIQRVEIKRGAFKK